MKQLKRILLVTTSILSTFGGLTSCNLFNEPKPQLVVTIGIQNATNKVIIIRRHAK